MGTRVAGLLGTDSPDNRTGRHCEGIGRRSAWRGLSGKRHRLPFRCLFRFRDEALDRLVVCLAPVPFLEAKSNGHAHQEGRQGRMGALAWAAGI